MRQQSVLATIAISIALVTAGCAGSVVGVPESGGADPATAGSGGPAAEEVAANEQRGSAAASVSQPGAARSGRTIHVAATGQVETEPNQVILRVAVDATGETASIVRQRLSENVSRMRSALSEMGIEGSQLTTAYYDISRDRRYGPEERERPPFRGTHAFSITLTDTDRTGEVIVTAVENGATSVDDVRFTLSEETRRELRREALADAMTHARNEATVVAGSAGLSITGVATIRTADVDYRPVRYETAALAAGGGGGTTIEGGAVTVSASVDVTYNATG